MFSTKIAKEPGTSWSGGYASGDFQRDTVSTNGMAKVIEKEARLDVPLPLQITPRMDYFGEQVLSEVALDQNSIMVGYATSMTPPQLTQFYEHQMECFGWKKIFSHDSIESLLIFQKPYAGFERLCTVTIRSTPRSGSELIICAGSLQDHQKTLSFD